MPRSRNDGSSEFISAQAGIQRQKHGGGSFVSAVERLPVAIVITDSTLSDNPIIFSNEAFLRLVGYTLPQVLGRTYHFFMGPDIDPLVTSLIDRAFAASEEAEIRLYHKSGAPVWASVSVNRIIDAAGAEIQRTISFVDISRRRAAEEELQRAYLLLERRVAERTEALNAALAQKDMLLREVNHRAKNTIQLAISLFNIQARTDPERAEQFNPITHQLSMLAHVYQLLDRAPAVDMINAGECLRSVVAGLVQPFVSTGRAIRLETDIADVFLPSDLVVDIALIANEALTNVLKHAYPGRQSGTVKLGFRTKAPKTAELTISDDGVGRIEPRADQNSFGNRMTESLIKKNHGDVKRSYDHGTHLVFVIPTP